MDKCAGTRYNKYDTLTSKQDLSLLFETLNSVKDQHHHAVKITAVSLTTNPYFERIKVDSFQNYYKPFATTLERYNKTGVFELWQQGTKENIFIPEFHGREHLNIQLWLRVLQEVNKEAK
ncbi:MAG TPA: hypothetical protein VLZ83_02185 [Edaphocola sp.]|nr:hypothetical protein [Edaphocola sp.]